MFFLICSWLSAGSEKARAPPQQVTFWSYFSTASPPTVSTSLSRYFGFSNDSPSTPNGRVVWQPTEPGAVVASERLFHRLLERAVAEVLDQHLDHVAHRLLAFIAEAGVLENVVHVRQQLAGGAEAVLGLLGAEAAG